MDNELVEIFHFTGEYQLSAVKVDEDVNEDNEMYTTVSLVLDDVIYTFSEDPVDGQQSRLGDIRISDWTDILNIFEPHTVVGEVVNNEEETSLYFLHPGTDEIIIRIGTIEPDSDSPFFVFDYNQG